MNELKQQIKQNKIPSFVYITGEEIYLVEYYCKKVIDTVMSKDEQQYNFHRFTGEEITVGMLEQFINTISFFNDKKVIFISGGKIDKAVENYLSEVICTLGDMTYIVVKGEKLDKRKKFYKNIVKCGTYEDYGYLGVAELTKFIAVKLKKYDLSIKSATAQYFIDYVGDELTNIVNELEKLGSYVSGKEVMKRHIDSVCSRSIQSSVFRLVDTFGRGELKTALNIYDDLLYMKVKPQSVLAMINRQFDLLYQTKKLVSDGHSIKEVSRYLGVRDFIIEKAYRQGRNMELNKIKQGFKKSVDMTGLIREGVYSDVEGVRQLVIDVIK